MTYVVANLHGERAKFEALLEKIRFGDRDVLYVLGDVVDYGAESMELLVDMSMRSNVYPIAGEHDFRALRMLQGFENMLRAGSMPDAAFASEMQAFAAEGGQVTLGGFRALDADMREGVLDYLSDFALYEEVKVGGRQYVLAHAGIGGFNPEKPLENYEPQDFFTPPEPGARFFRDRTLIVGHVPTASGRIEREDGIVRIDCGVTAGGPLGCLCLETDEEYYV